MAVLTRAFALRRPVDEVHAFVAALRGPRSADVSQFYRHYGISHESWHVQETKHGPWVIVVTVVDDVTASERYRAASDEFHDWFKAQVLHLSGIDPNVDPRGPETNSIFSWSDTERPHSHVFA